MPMRKKRVGLLIDIAIVCAILAIGSYLALRSVAGFLQNREYFKIKYVKCNDSAIDVARLLGKNIFSLDLKEQARNLRAQYPAYQSIKLTKYLPNCLLLECKKRKAVAVVRLYRFFSVGEDAVLFESDTQGFDQPLPVITGLETKIFGPKSGIRYNVKELNSALELIRQVNSIAALKNYKINKIDVSKADNLSFYILNNIEIRIGGNDIARKVKILPSLFTHIGANINKLKYIDLRFKEPVIKYKNET